MESLKERVTKIIEAHLIVIRRAQNNNNRVVKEFFEKVFESNGQTPICYKGENEGVDNFINDGGDIIVIKEIYPDVETINGKQVSSIKVKGIDHKHNCIYLHDLMNLDSRSIVSIFEIFKDQI